MDIKLGIDILGWIGAVLLLWAYFQVSHKKWDGNSLVYNMYNVIGSVLVGANALYFGALPSTGINIIWLVIGVHALTRIRRGKHIEA